MAGGNLPKGPHMITRAPIRGRAMTAVLVAAVVAAAGMLGYTIAYPPQPERYTEFYLLGADGKAEGYPDELVLGEEARAIVGIVNREQKIQDYRLEIRAGGILLKEIVDINLQPDEKRQKEVVFLPEQAGMQQKVQFVLYKQGGDKPYGSLYLWVDVYEGNISGKANDLPFT